MLDICGIKDESILKFVSKHLQLKKFHIFFYGMDKLTASPSIVASGKALFQSGGFSAYLLLLYVQYIRLPWSVNIPLKHIWGETNHPNICVFFSSKVYVSNENSLLIHRSNSVHCSMLSSGEKKSPIIVHTEHSFRTHSNDLVWHVHRLNMLQCSEFPSMSKDQYWNIGKTTTICASYWPMEYLSLFHFFFIQTLLFIHMYNPHHICLYHCAAVTNTLFRTYWTV